MNAKKIAAALLAVVLLIGIGVGGTLAWLMDYTKEVKNTFTVGNINIDLQETVNGESKSAKEGPVGNDNYTIIPGTTQPKDPKVIVEENSEDCYVFVQITADNTTIEDFEYTINSVPQEGDVTFVDWDVAAGWTELDGVKNVYYREYTSGNKETYSVLAGDKVTYPSALIKEQIDALTVKPSLTFKAYAVQMNYSNSEGTTVKFTPKQAWDVANGLNPGVTTP